jgi:hypothetical protein
MLNARGGFGKPMALQAFNLSRFAIPSEVEKSLKR